MIIEFTLSYALYVSSAFINGVIYSFFMNCTLYIAIRRCEGNLEIFAWPFFFYVFVQAILRLADLFANILIAFLIQLVLLGMFAYFKDSSGPGS